MIKKKFPTQSRIILCSKKYRISENNNIYEMHVEYLSHGAVRVNFTKFNKPIEIKHRCEAEAHEK